MMNLYLIERDEGDFDEVLGFVIRANSFQKARKMAAEACGDEGRAVWYNQVSAKATKVATNVGGKHEILLTDYKSYG